jgi:hypothetical protein
MSSTRRLRRSSGEAPVVVFTASFRKVPGHAYGRGHVGAKLQVSDFPAQQKGGGDPGMRAPTARHSHTRHVTAHHFV